jgi:DNA-binding NarL/FixJ family response regulator
MKTTSPVVEEESKVRAGSVSLTPRQLEVLGLIAQGATDNEIAVQLVISSQTVSVHVRAIRRALGARSRSQAVALAIQQGLLPAAAGDPPETPS